MHFMRNETLLLANPYLQDPEVRKKLLAKTACTSSSIEGVTFSVEETLLGSFRESPPKHRRPSAATAAAQG